MNQRAIFRHFSVILDKLISKSDFYKIYFQAPYTTDDDIKINNFLSLSTGISRGCLIDKRYNYVVKFQLNNVEKNFCDKESNIYDYAMACGLEKCFARPIYIGTYTNTFKSYLLDDVLQTIDTWYDEDEFYKKFPEVKEFCEKTLITISIDLFAYPRAKTHIPLNSYSQNDEKYAKNFSSPLGEFNLAIAAEFISEYGEEFYDSLTDFLYHWGINDIHYGNIGKINGNICIIDYAGA